MPSVGTSSRRGAASKPAVDETSSERAFNAASEYEMGDRKHDGQTSVVFADADALSSDEAVNRARVAGRDGNRAGGRARKN